MPKESQNRDGEDRSGQHRDHSGAGEEKAEKGNHKPTPLRTVNGGFAALTCFIFLAHVVLGAWKFFDLSFEGRFVWVVWVGVGVLVAHIALSVGTTVSMLTDTKRPPSAKKKRHQLLKWVTGLTLLAAVLVHVCTTSAIANGGVVHELSWLEFALMIAVAAALAWHIFVASKSLLKDLRVPDHKRYRPAMQAMLLGCVGVAAVILVIAMFSQAGR